MEMDTYLEGAIQMLNVLNANNTFISVGFDVGADFSYMSIALPNQQIVVKPIKVIHSNHSSLENCVKAIKEAEEMYFLESRIFLESTGVYHYPLFCFLRDKGLNCSVYNPIITKNSTNINIRKVENDKFDSKKVALIGLNPDLKVSVIPCDLVLNLRNLTREYYSLADHRSAYVNKLQGQLRMVFPQYRNVFSKITINTSLELLDKYTSPEAFIAAGKSEIIEIIRKTSRFGDAYAENKYNAIIEAAKAAKVFGHWVPSSVTLIRLYIKFIKKYDEEIEAILAAMNEFVKLNENELFVKQIGLIQTIKGAGFLTAVTVMCEIGDFSVFKSPKQLFAYFGLDPSVRQSGNYNSNKNKMSKRGSSIARRAIHTIAVIFIGKTKNGVAHNQVALDYYQAKCKSKPKMVALGAVMHKVCNIIFAVLRDNKEFCIVTPQEHNERYQNLNKVA
jgi:transposase